MEKYEQLEFDFDYAEEQWRKSLAKWDQIVELELMMGEE